MLLYISEHMSTIPHRKEDIAKAMAQLTKPGPGECILWTGDRNKFGTPYLRISNRLMDSIKIAWWLKHGYKPWWAYMKRKCSTAHCMNPDHFTDNTPPQKRKTYLISGNFLTFEPFDDQQLWERNKAGETMRAIAKKHKVDVMTVCRSINRHRKLIGEPGRQSSRKPVDRRPLRAAVERCVLWGELIAVVAKECGLSKRKLINATKAFRKKNREK